MPEPLLLLPGMMCDARLFAAQVARFSPRRAVMVAPMAGSESVDGMAAAILAQAPPRFALAGLSMGGIVAMEMFRQAPDRIARLALLDTNPLAETDAGKVVRDRQIADVRAGQLRAVMRDEMKPRYLAHGPGRDAVLALCMEMSEACGPPVFIEQSLALRDRPDQQEALRACRVPALALCGREDHLCPLARHELIASLIPGCVLRVIEGAGHLPTLEQPAAANDALAGWLDA